jgi:IS4 transposase
MPPARVRALADEVGLVERQRKVDPVALLWSLILGFALGKDRTIAALRRAYEKATKTTLVPSAFYDRFTPTLVRFLVRVLQFVIDKVAEPTQAAQAYLAAFKDVVAIDATVIRLHELLARAFPGCRTNHTKAALKLHVVMSARGGGPRTVKITDERKNDGRTLRVGKWVAQKLLLFDLGYFRYQLFDCIDRNKGFFLTRLKVNANPLITAAHRAWRGASVKIVGERLQDVLGRLQRKVIDVEIEANFSRRVYSGKRSGAKARFRLVGVFNEETDRYHLYVTNLPADKFPAEAVAAIYRARWAVELLFKSLKSDFALEDLPSSKKHIVEALVYATIITWVVSHAVRNLLAAHVGEEARRITALRWTRVLRACADDILAIMVAPPRHGTRLAAHLEAVLLAEALDPHRNRSTLFEDADHGRQARRRQPKVA